MTGVNARCSLLLSADGGDEGGAVVPEPPVRGGIATEALAG